MEEFIMCGIVGYAGGKNGIFKTITGLKTLEYRGYDSSGIAYMKDDKINIIKRKGEIKNLENDINFDEETNIIISHTRWATHGVADDINAHPHRQGKITLVHNGIIENYYDLKKELMLEGYLFVSDTDSEVAAAMIDSLYNKYGDMVNVLCKLRTIFKGSYALNIINDDYIDTIFGVRKDSPLIVGLGDGENILASDIPAIMHITNKYFVANNDEIVVVTKDEVKCYDSSGNIILKEIKETNNNSDIISKNGYYHFMLKEINEQSDVVKRLISIYTTDGYVNDIFDIKKYKNIDIVACGSASFAGQLGKYFIEKYADIKVNVYFASEYRYQKNFFNKDTLFIAISQSGETADTLASLKLAKKNNVDTLAIVNRRESSIAREADSVIYTEAGIEVAVATTKAYLAQVIILLLIAIKGCDEEGTIVNELKLLPNIIIKYINEFDYKYYAGLIKDRKHIFYLGRGIDYFLAMEGSLKLKEISYIHSEAFQAGELKHGSISLIDDDFGVIALVTDKNVCDKSISNIQEVAARGAKILAITNIKDNSFSDYSITIDDNGEIINFLSVIVVMQLLAYNVAKLKGLNIDKPRNLAKSVTVE